MVDAVVPGLACLLFVAIVAFEETHGNEYVAIERKARKKGDIEVLELVQTLAAEKRADKLERVREQALEYYRTHGYDPDRNYHKRKKLSRWEKAVLYGVIDLDACDEDHLQHIVDVCTLTEDDLHKSLAEQLMQWYVDNKASLRSTFTTNQSMIYRDGINMWMRGVWTVTPDCSQEACDKFNAIYGTNLKSGEKQYYVAEMCNYIQNPTDVIGFTLIKQITGK